MEPPSTPSGRSRHCGAVAVAACALLACLVAGAASQSPTPSQPPPVGAPAPDFPLFDTNNNESSLREVLKEKTVVLVFFIGYT